MTGFLQPADVGWFATIKKCYSCNNKKCSQMLNNVDGASPEKTKKGKEGKHIVRNCFVCVFNF